MLETALTFKKLIHDATEALFLFSGHGKGEDWKNLLAPVDLAGGYDLKPRCVICGRFIIIIF